MAGRLIDEFLDAGGSFIDTADIYGRDGSNPAERRPGASEETLGTLLRGRRDRVFLATKVGQASVRQPAVDEVGLAPQRIRHSVDASLKRLQTDWIDLYQLHLWDPYTPVDQILEVLLELVREGKVRHIGVSNWDGWQVVEAALRGKDLGIAIGSNQVWYNVLDRQVENSVIPACQQLGAAVIAYGALAQGLLCGDFSRPVPRPTAGRFAFDSPIADLSWKGLDKPRTWAIVEAVTRLADVHGVPVPAVALRWMLDASDADFVLVAPRHSTQLLEFLQVFDVTFEREEADLLTALSALPATYPKSFTDAYARRESPHYGGLIEQPR